MKKLNYSVLILMTVIFGCNSNNQDSQKRNYTDQWQQYISHQIDSLTIANPRLIKTINKGDQVETLKIDSVDWNNELSGILAIDFSKEKKKVNYSESSDSTANISMKGYFAKDTNAFLQSFEITKVNGKIDLLVWKTKTRSFLIDRDQILAFQPGKGFRINIHENSLWAEPKDIEIFGDIQNKAFLER